MLYRSTTRSLFISFAISWVASLLSGTSADAQQPPIVNFAPDDVVICVTMTGELKPGATGSGFERWLAQSEVKDSFLNLVDLIEEQIEENDPAWKGIAAMVPQIVFNQPWIIYLEEPNWDEPKFKFVSQLGELEGKVREKLEELTQDSDSQITEFKVSGETFQRIIDNGGTTFEMGFYKNHFLLAVGNGELEKLMGRLNSKQPKWATELKAELPVERTLGMMVLDVKRLMESLPEPSGDADETLKQLKLDEIEKIVGVTGFDGEETVNRLSFHCPKTLTGIWSTFDVKPLSAADYKGVSDSVHSLSSIRFNPEFLWKFLLENEDSQADVEEFQAMMEEEFGIDFAEDILKNLGEHVYSYQQFSLLNPQANALIGFQIRNPEQFQAKLEKFIDKFEETNESFGFDVEETKDGPLYQMVPFEPEMQMVFPGVCFQLVENQLLVALDSKAISSHIRKSKRDGGKLVEDPRMAWLFNSKQNGNLGQPIGIFYVDVKVLIESVYAVVPMVLGQFEQMGGGDSGFDMEMLPPLEKTVNGVLPNIIALYRTERGFQIVERSTLPGISASSGLAVAMLLPAVQQVRSAARRATSQNNLRQFALAIHNYESAYQALPPAYQTKDKKKLLSWRVAILPYIEQQELYEKFKLDEPWDSPHNKALIEEMPEIFQVPGLDLEAGKTVYLGVTGDGCALIPSEKKTGLTFGEIIDGTSNTLLLVEANKDQAVYWTQPEDFNVDTIEDPVTALKGNWPAGTFNAAMCDGSVQSLSVSNEKLLEMATVDGGELDDEDDEEDREEEAAGEEDENAEGDGEPDVAAGRVVSQNNLRQLSIALHNYDSAFGAFPPAYQTKDKQKLLSWRVAILPFVEENELYEKFKHDEPWDSPHNKALIKKMPKIFRHPTLDLEPGQTVYLGVAGAGCFMSPSEKKQGLKIAQILDGTTRTLMLVEANEDHAVYWTQPEDFNLDTIEDPVAALKGNWPDETFNAMMCDASHHRLKVSNKKFLEMATIAGGESNDDEEDDE